MDQDNELNAMASIKSALELLSDEEKLRVLQWAVSKYQPKSGSLQSPTLSLGPTGTDQVAQSMDISDLFQIASPRTDSEKALVVGYWFQYLQKQPTVDGQQVNTALKNLGHGIKNITTAMDDLINRRPAEVMQVQKTGTSKQARKKYKLTIAGLQRVQEMLRRNENNTPAE